MIRNALKIFNMTALLAVAATFTANTQQLSPVRPTEAAVLHPITNQANVFIKAESGFDTDITAALEKKKTPLSVVIDPVKAAYVLEATGIDDHPESTKGMIARCLFADCIGMNGYASVSVRLLRSADGTVLWAYQVRKGLSGPMARQSLSEAIAKHLKKYLLEQQEHKG